MNPNITMRDILAHTIPWDLQYISMNPNINMEDILANPDKPWDWWCISQNWFNKSKEVLANIEKRIQHRKDCYVILNDYMISDISHLVVLYL
jgi:hypothetical protein